MAETGVKDLFKGILHLVSEARQQAERSSACGTTSCRSTRPEWKSQFDTIVQVGLGTTDDETKIAFLTQVAAKQEQILLQMGPQNPIVSMEQYVNTLRSIAEIGGFKDVDQFFNSPQMIRQQMMMQAQQQQAPQPDPEMVKLMKFEREMG